MFGIRVVAIDVVTGLHFLTCSKPVIGIGEPDGIVFSYDNVVGGVEVFAFVLFDNRFDGAAGESAGDTVGGVLGTKEIALTIKSVAVGVVGGFAEGLYSFGAGPLFEFAGGDVAEDEAVVFSDPNGAFDELHAGGEAFDLCIFGEEFGGGLGVFDFEVGGEG